MGLLSSPARIGAIALVAGVAAAVTALSAACQAVVGSDGAYFDPAGLTTLAQFSDFDSLPGSLVLVGDELFFLQGTTLFAVATSGDGTQTPVHTFTGTPTSLAYDGADLLYACDSAAGLVAFSVSQRSDVAPPLAGHVSCFTAVASPDEVAYATQIDGDGGAQISLFLATTQGVTEPKTLPGDPADLSLGIDGELVFASVLQKLRALEGGDVCTLAQIGSPDTPKVTAAHLSDGGARLLARGGNDRVRFVDESQPCCEADADQAACSGAPSSSTVIPLNGDFTVGGGFVYWSLGGAISRQSLDDFPGTAGVTSVTSTGSSANAIPSLVVDDRYVYFVLGPRVLRAPLP
jgi:hypothetical protein